MLAFFTPIFGFAFLNSLDVLDVISQQGLFAEDATLTLLSEEINFADFAPRLKGSY